MTINCKGTLVEVSSPKVMGVLNITPDSFFDGGRYKNDTQILSQVEKMLTEGATFIDVGAYSSRPGAIHISEEEELKRIVPVIDLLVKKFPEIILSIDTFRSKVARETIHTGANYKRYFWRKNRSQYVCDRCKFKSPLYLNAHVRNSPKHATKS